MVFKFHNSLKSGKVGEEKLKKIFPGLVPTSGRKGDFTLSNGLIVEVKTDFYEHKKTENLFLERYSSLEKQTNGGPWQAAEHGCTYFVYFYINSGIGYCYQVDKLVEQADKVLTSLVPVQVKNHSWITLGYKAPRKLFEPEFSFSVPPIRLLTGDKQLFEQFLGRANE